MDMSPVPPHQPPYLPSHSPYLPTPAPSLDAPIPAPALKLVIKMPKASYEEAVAKANLKRARHSDEPDQLSSLPPTPLSLVPGFPPPQHPTATPTTPIRYATPTHKMFLHDEELAVGPYATSSADFTTPPPPKKASKKRKSLSLTDSTHIHHLHDHSPHGPSSANGATAVVTPSSTSTKKRIRRDSSGLTSPSTPFTPNTPSTPTANNTPKPRKPTSARARKIEAKQQLAVDEEAYARMMEVMEMEEDIDSLEVEIKKLEESKLNMRKEFSFLESIPIQKAPRVVEEPEQYRTPQASVGGGNRDRDRESGGGLRGEALVLQGPTTDGGHGSGGGPMHMQQHLGNTYAMGSGKQGGVGRENSKMSCFHMAYEGHHEAQRYPYYPTTTYPTTTYPASASSFSSSPLPLSYPPARNARPPSFTVKIAPPPPTVSSAYHPGLRPGHTLPPFPMNTSNATTASSSSYLQEPHATTYPYGVPTTDHTTFYPANSFHQSEETYRPRYNPPYHLSYNSYPTSAMASPPTSSPPNSPPTSPPLTTNSYASTAPFAPPNSNPSYMPQSYMPQSYIPRPSQPTTLQCPESTIYPPLTRTSSGPPPFPSPLKPKPQMAAGKQPPTTPVAAQSKHALPTYGKPTPYGVSSKLPHSSTSVTTTAAPNPPTSAGTNITHVSTSIHVPTVSTPPTMKPTSTPPSKSAASTPPPPSLVFPPQTLKVRAQAYPPQSIKPPASTYPKTTITIAKNPAPSVPSSPFPPRAIPAMSPNASTTSTATPAVTPPPLQSPKPTATASPMASTPALPPSTPSTTTSSLSLSSPSPSPPSASSPPPSVPAPKTIGIN